MLLGVLVALLSVPLAMLFLGLVWVLVLSLFTYDFADSSTAGAFGASVLTIVIGVWFCITIKCWRRSEGLKRIFGLSVSSGTALTILFLSVTWLASKPDYPQVSKDRRNAQNLATVCFAAESAGLAMLDENSLENTIKNISTGSMVDDPECPFFETFFGLPNLVEAT